MSPWQDFKEWLGELVADVFGWLFDLLGDVAIWIVEAFGGAIVAMLGAIPVPAVIANGLSSIFSLLDSGITYYVTALGVPEALAMIGAAYAFRLVRKVVTLFQW